MNDSNQANITIEELEELKGAYARLDLEYTRLVAEPVAFATVVKADNAFDLSVFEKGDRMISVDRKFIKAGKHYGRLESNGVDKDGWAVVSWANGSKDRVNIGIGMTPQVKLAGKDDGMNVVIAIDGRRVEVHGLPDKLLDVGDEVRVNMGTKQIVGSAGVTSAGEVAAVRSVVDERHIEVESSGHTRVVIHGIKGEEPGSFAKVEPGDRVMLDATSTVSVRLLARDGADRFNLLEQMNTTWDDIAGLGEVKEEMRDALEMPYLMPDIYQYYGRKPPKGILLSGPPGCGKTMIGKATANSMARIHVKENYQSGFIYVKGAEILSKWVGESEATIRQLFLRAREHYARHGYPAVLFIDEADAILPERNSRKCSDVEKTIVPMFLSEMDGLEEANITLLLATNQPKSLDPAVIREGRVDRHIRVSRPNVRTAAEYFKIHLKAPLANGVRRDELIEIAVNDLFSDKRHLYRVSHDEQAHLFRLSDAASGAMIAGVCQYAAASAMKRDLASGKKTGVTAEDFKLAIHHTHKTHAESNPSFDLDDFCDTRGLPRDRVAVSKVPLVVK